MPYRVTLLTLLGRWTELVVLAYFVLDRPQKPTIWCTFKWFIIEHCLRLPRLKRLDIHRIRMQDVKLRPKMHFLQCPLGLPCPRCLPLRLFRPFWRTNNHFSNEVVTPSWDKNVFWCWFWWMLSLSLSCSSKHREELSFATRSQLNVHW